MDNKKVFKVLIVGHDQKNQLLAINNLEDKGLLVESAKSGYEALEALNQSTYDLILMGCEMPDMDGFETAELIRDDSLFTQSRIPILAWTSSMIWNLRKRCRQAGINDYIKGPLSAEDLYSKIQFWVNQPQLETTS